MRKEPSLTKRCEKRGKDAKRAKFHKKIGKCYIEVKFIKEGTYKISHGCLVIMIYDVFRVKVTLEVRENRQDAKRTKFLMKTNTVLAFSYIELVHMKQNYESYNYV